MKAQLQNTKMQLTDDFLLIEVKDDFSVELAINVVDQTQKKCLESNEKRVLLDVRNMPGKISVMDRFRVAMHARVLAKHAIKTAIIGREDQILSDKFLENVLFNRGVQAFVSSRFEEGRHWLSQFTHK